ncbi:MAG: protease modulator HflC [Rhizobiaceae bacterium]|nr:protease modulator HflC [Rhizobiaceae bacterium]
MSNRFYGGLLFLTAVFLVVWSSVFVVNEREQAVVLRFGQIQRVITEPGLYFKLPFGFASADAVQMLPDRLLRSDLADLEVQVSGGARYVVDAFMVYRISDARRFRAGVQGGQLEIAEQRLLTRFNSAIRDTYGRRSFDSALSASRAEMMVEIRDQVRPEASALGITLEDVRISRTDLTAEVSETTYRRMESERLTEAERLRAEGQVSAREIRAAADRESSETLATARRDAVILQGEGEAERNATYANVFGRNTEFFEFYRSMQAYRTSLQSGGPQMVLSPNSEFFRYFKADGQDGAMPSVELPETSAVTPVNPPTPAGATPAVPAEPAEPPAEPTPSPAPSGGSSQAPVPAESSTAAEALSPADGAANAPAVQIQ